MNDQSSDRVKARRHQIVLVHGTFARPDADAGTGWSQLSGVFRVGLQERLDYLADCEPPPLFKWSGLNDEGSRRIAASELLDRLRALESQQIPYHLVAHSHGGSVVWEALVQSVPRRLRFLKSWTTVGTPYLHFAIDRGRLAFLAVLLMFLVAFLYATLPSAMAAVPVIREIVETLPWHTTVAYMGVIVLTIIGLGAALFAVVTLTLTCIQFVRDRAARRKAWGFYRHTFVPIFADADEACSSLRTAASIGGPITTNPVVNDFVWTQIKKFIFGVKRFPLVPLNVSTTPVGELAHCPLIGKELSRELTTVADESLAKQASVVRPLLADASLAIQPLLHLEDSLRRQASLDALIHCGYFANPSFVEVIAKAIEHCHRYRTSPLRQSLRSLPKWRRPVFTTRASRFVLCEAAVLTGMLGILLVLHILTDGVVGHFFQRAITADGMAIARLTVPIIPASLKTHHTRPWIDELIASHLLKEASDFSMSLPDPLIRSQCLLEITAEALDTNDSAKGEHLRTLMGTLVDVPDQVREKASYQWFRLERKALSQVCRLPRTSATSDLESSFTSLIDHACVDAAAQKGYIIPSFTDLANRLYDGERTAEADKVVSRALAYLEQDGQNAFQFSNLHEISRAAMRGNDKNAFVILQDALFRWFEANGAKASAVELRSLHNILARAGDMRAETVGEKLKVAEISAPQITEDLVIMNLINAGELDAAFERVQNLKSAWSRFDRYNNLIEAMVGPSASKLRTRIVASRSGELEFSDDDKGDLTPTTSVVADKRRLQDCVQNLLQASFALVPEGGMYQGRVRKDAIKSLFLSMCGVSEALPEPEMRVWKMARQFGEPADEYACEIAAAVMLNDEKQLAEGRSRFLAAVQVKVQEIEAEANTIDDERERRGTHHTARMMRLEADVFLANVDAVQGKSELTEATNALVALQSAPNESFDVTEDLWLDIWLRWMWEPAVQNDASADQCCKVIQKMHDPNLRIVCRATLGEVAGKRGRRELSIRLCNETLDDAELGGSRRLSKRLLARSRALAAVGHLRSAMNEMPYLETYDRMDGLRAIFSSLRSRKSFD